MKAIEGPSSVMPVGWASSAFSIQVCDPQLGRSLTGAEGSRPAPASELRQELPAYPLVNSRGDRRIPSTLVWWNTLLSYTIGGKFIQSSHHESRYSAVELTGIS